MTDTKHSSEGSAIRGGPAALETMITSFRGVRSARVQVDESGEISVWILAVPEVTTAEAIRVAISAAAAHGAVVAPHNVQVFRTEGDVADPHARRRLSSVAIERVDGGVKVKISLELAGDVLIGESSGWVGRGAELRAGAVAVLNAAGKLLDFPVDVAAVDTLEVGSCRAVTVMLERPEGPPLVGSAMVRSGDIDAAVCATLAALNRFMKSS